jgi:hypothetical protein
MSDKFTSIRFNSVPVYATRGHVSYEDAVTEAKQHYQHQLTQADAVLSAIRRGEIQIYHQTGIFRVRNRIEITPGTILAAQ